MADEIVYKKVTRKADKGLEGKVIAKHGKQTNQKLKPYVVLQYLLKYSDENNTKSAYDIIGYWRTAAFLRNAVLFIGTLRTSTALCSCSKRILTWTKPTECLRKRKNLAMKKN